MSKSVREEQQLLRRVGWPIAADGVLGPRTRQARRDFKAAQSGWIRRSHRRYRRRLRWCAEHDGKVRPGAHFYYRDWRSKGNGWVKVKRNIYVLAERIRKRVGAFGVLSGYRDPVHNKRVGGASRSYHLLAQAVDPTKSLPIWAVQDAGAGGIGIGDDGACRHFDTGPRRTWSY